MALRKDVKEIKQLLEQISKDTLYKAKEYDKLIDLLKMLPVKISKIHTQINKDLTYSVKIEYEIPSVEIKVDKNSYIPNNDSFKAINLLNLLSMEDAQKISKEIEKAKKLNQQ